MSAHPAVRFVAPIVVAIVLGPLAAGLGVCLFAIGNSILNPNALLALSDVVALSWIYILFAYLIGWPIALLAGVLVALWMLRRPPSALIANAAAVIAAVAFMALAATGMLGPAQEINGRSNFLFALVAAVFAANACWFLMRCFARPTPALAS